MSRIFWTLLILITVSTSAFAHTASRSFSIWEEQGKVILGRYSIDQTQATLLIPKNTQNTELSALLVRHLAGRLHVIQKGARCTTDQPVQTQSLSGKLEVSIRFTCPDQVNKAGWTLQNNAFFDLASTHIHIAQIENDPEAREFIFTNAQRQHIMRNKAGESEGRARVSFWVNFTTYIRLGITHILSGFDHLAFVTALILLAKTYKDVAFLVTGFTLGHSITLSLAALGIIHPYGAAIEALIGFSIAFIALELLLPPGSPDWQRLGRFIPIAFIVLAGVSAYYPGALAPLSWIGLALFIYCYFQLVENTQTALKASLALTIAFGLVHGAGFASVLSEAGLPAGQRISALAGFNIGVEIGQLAVVGLWLVIFALLGQFMTISATTRFKMLIGTVVFTLGIYWFASRAFI